MRSYSQAYGLETPPKADQAAGSSEFPEAKEAINKILNGRVRNLLPVTQPLSGREARSDRAVGIDFGLDTTKTRDQDAERVFAAETLHRSLQELRDEVRMMVAERRPRQGIPMYLGYRYDGDPVSFLETKYASFLPKDGSHTLFLHDLREIDPRLATAIENIGRKHPVPIGRKKDLINAVAKGDFYDGSTSQRRVKNALRQRIARSS
jgi:hypothetical protein